MSKREFLDGARASHQEVLAAIDGVDEATLTGKMVCGTWTSKDVLGHLAAVDGVILDGAKQAGRGEKIVWAFSGVADWNDVEAANRASTPLAAVLDELNANRGALLAELERWPADAGPFGPDSWDVEKSEIGWLSSHDLEHAQALRSR